MKYKMPIPHPKKLLVLLTFLACTFFQIKSLYAQAIVATGSSCSGNDILFDIVPAPSPAPDSVVWDFGDPTSGILNKSRALRPTHAFLSAGTYNVKVDIYNGGVKSTLNLTPSIIIKQSPQPFSFIPQDSIICPGTSITLDPYPMGAPSNSYKYLWSTGEKTKSISVNKTNCYSVTVTDTVAGCDYTSKINVKVYRETKKEGARWFFGDKAGLNFQPTPPKAVTGSLQSSQGSSVISDSQGHLLFYTDGVNVYDSLGVKMNDINGNPVTLSGDTASTQSALIVPQPDDKGCQSTYYVFTTSKLLGGSGLQYSLVDMRLNAGKGAIVQKNIPLVPSASAFASPTEKLTAYTSQSGKTYVITHDFNKNTFRVIPVNKQGIDFTLEKKYNLGSVHGPDPENASGYMKISADGTKLAVTIPGAPGKPNYVEIFQYEDSTGKIKPNPIKLNLGNALPSVYGVDFSNDGSVLYVSKKGDNSNASVLYQYDVIKFDSASVAKSRFTLDSTKSVQFGAIQVGADSKIYMALNGKDSLAVVNSPSLLGKNAGYKRNGIQLLAGTKSLLGLPNFVQSFFQPASGQGFAYRDTCSGGPTQLYAFPDLPDPGGKNQFSWDFGDGTTLASSGQAGQNPLHPYAITNGTNSQVFNVKLTIQNRCTTEVFTQKITILRAPADPVLLTNYSFCKGSANIIDPYPNQPGPVGATYVWIKPDASVVQTKSVIADIAGTYSFTVTVASCSKTASTVVGLSGVTVALGSDKNICEGQSVILDAENPGFNYQWLKNRSAIGGANQRFFTVTTTGEYIAQVTNPLSGCIGYDTILVNVTQKARVAIVPTNPSVCGSQDGSFAITFTSPGAFNTPTGQRTDVPGAVVVTPNGSGGYQANALFAGSYSFTFRATGTICDTTYLVSLSDPAPFTAVTSSTNVTNCTSPDGSITVTPNPSAGAYTYTWRNETTNLPIVAPPTLNVLSNQPKGQYSVKVSSGTCSVFLNNIIIKDVIKPTVQIAGDSVRQFCGTSGSTINLQILNPIVGTYTWSDGFGNSYSGSNINPIITNPTTVLTVTYTDPITSCTATDQTIIQLQQGAYAQLPHTTSVICEGDKLVLNANPSPPPLYDPSTVLYQWKDANNTILAQGLGLTTLSVTQSGTYTVKAQNNTGCPPVSDQTVVNVNVKPIFTASITKSIICLGETVTIKANPTNDPTNSFTYVLSDPNNNTLGSNNNGIFTFTPTVVSSYLYSLSVQNGTCTPIVQPVSLKVNPEPVTSLPKNVKYCINSIKPISADSANKNPPETIYLWNTGQTTKTINPTISGDYKVTISIGNCSLVASTHVDVTPRLNLSVASRTADVCAQDKKQATLSVSASNEKNIVYQWLKDGVPFSNGVDQTSITVTQAGKYVIIVTRQDDPQTSCVVSDTITVIDKCNSDIHVPNAFTPNNDGNKNDFLKVFVSPSDASGAPLRITDINDFEMLVYNRWGQAVFQSKDINEMTDVGWDGKFLGLNVPEGNYAWRIKYKNAQFPNKPYVVLTGGVLVLK